MKILMVNKFLYSRGGAETYVLKLGAFLRSKGHEVQYFGMAYEENCVGNAVGEYTSNMDFHGGRMLAKLTYPIRTIYSQEARRKIRRVLDSLQPDVVHINNFNYQLTPSIILEIVKWRKATGRDCRIVYTAHDANLVCPNHMLRNPNTHENCEKCIGGCYLNCIKARCIHGSVAKSCVGAMEGYFWKTLGVYRYFDRVVCCSHFIKGILDTDPLLAGKTLALHNFIDRVSWRETAKKDYALYFGRYAEEKGIDILVEVCRELPDIPFVFAGAGPLEARLQGVKNIHNVGFQAGEALEKLIREARFSVCPSQWYENCPFSVMESLMYGTPVIGANTGGIPELIQEGKTGELFEPTDKNALRAKIISFWRDTEKTAAYSNHCRDIDFDDIDTYYRRLMEIYVKDEPLSTPEAI